MTTPIARGFYYGAGDNKKVIGKMKDETVGVPITEFVGLRSKMYSYVTVGGAEGKESQRSEKVCS